MSDCSCAACAALLDECGDALFPLYRKKLLKQGWAGRYSPVEKTYRKTHAFKAKK